MKISAAATITDLAPDTFVPVAQASGPGFIDGKVKIGMAGADPGFMSAADKTKLDGVATGATANSTDAALRARADHTGGQAISTVTGLQAALDGKQASGSYAASTHSHAQSDVTGLVSALSGKADSAHSHAIADTTGLQAALDGKQASGSYAASSHTHTAANVTDFDAAVDARIALGGGGESGDPKIGWFI